MSVEEGNGKRMNVPIDSEQKWDALDGILKLLQDSHWHTVREIKEGIWLPEEKLASILRFFVHFDLIDYVNGKSRLKITPSGLSVLRLPSEYESKS
jgi:RIO-like serine/threonine protein kinase